MDSSCFRLISPCIVIYKLIFKTIVNKLKGVLPDIISVEKSAFVPNRQILEATHLLNKKPKVKNKFMNLKLDTSKAYNRIE